MTFGLAGSPNSGGPERSQTGADFFVVDFFAVVDFGVDGFAGVDDEVRGDAVGVDTGATTGITAAGAVVGKAGRTGAGAA